MAAGSHKALFWAPGAKGELERLPRSLMRNFGYALSAVQFGRTPTTSVKALHGFGLPLLELRGSDPAGTYRVVFCTALGDVIYVLHCFQKKSGTGGKIPQETIALIKRRLNQTRLHHEEINKRS